MGSSSGDSASLNRTTREVIREGARIATLERGDIQQLVVKIKGSLNQLIPRLISIDDKEQRNDLSKLMVQNLSEPLREILRESTEPAVQLVRNASRKLPAHLDSHKKSLAMVTYSAMVDRLKGKMSKTDLPDDGEAVRSILWGSGSEDGLHDLIMMKRNQNTDVAGLLINTLHQSLSKHIAKSFKLLINNTNRNVKYVYDEIDEFLKDIVVRKEKERTLMDALDTQNLSINLDSLRLQQYKLEIIQKRLLNIPIYDILVCYKSRIPNIYIHYKTNGKKWTKSPGLKMIQHVGDSLCYLIFQFSKETTIECCFNNGDQIWDNNNGNNYKIAAGEYLIERGSIRAISMP